MRKLGARSIAVALLALLVCGCSTGGKKSFSMSSMNPMRYFAKSDSDSQVPKPSDQMAPNVTLGDASDVASTSGLVGGMAPPSPYGATQTSLGLAQGEASLSPTNLSPQRGTYSLAPPSSGPDAYPTAPVGSGYNPPSSGIADYQAPVSGYSMPPNTSGYETSNPAQYALGGGSYDIRSQTQGSTPEPPAYANPTAPYGNNAGADTTPYQMPPLPPQTNGYDRGLAQDPYGNTNPPSYPGAVSASPSVPWGVNPAATYADSSLGNATESRDMSVATLPKLPPLPDRYTNSQPAYEPGNTGYNPAGIPKYTPPSAGGYVQPAAATEPTYSPGSVSRYPSVPSQPAATAGAGARGYGTSGSVY